MFGLYSVFNKRPNQIHLIYSEQYVIVVSLTGGLFEVMVENNVFW